MIDAADYDKIFGAIAHRLHSSVEAVKSKFNLSAFVFDIDFLPATLNAFTTGTFLVQNDSAFVIMKTVYTATLTDNVSIPSFVTVAAPATTFVLFPGSMPLLVNLTDTGSGRQFSNVDVDIDNWFGTSQRPFLWTTPQVLDPNSTFSMRVQNLSTTTSFNVRCAFHGYKVFGDVQAFRKRRSI